MGLGQYSPALINVPRGSTRLCPVLQVCGHLLQVGDEGGHLQMARLFVGRSKDRGRMDSGRDNRHPRRLEELTTLGADPEIATEQGLGCGRPQADDYAGPDHRQLGVEPRPAGLDLGRIGLLMEPFLAARLPLEVFDRVGHVDQGPVDAGLLEGAIQKAPGWADERFALDVLAIAGLLSNEHDRRAIAPLTKYGLSA